MQCVARRKQHARLNKWETDSAKVGYVVTVVLVLTEQPTFLNGGDIRKDGDGVVMHFTGQAVH